MTCRPNKAIFRKALPLFKGEYRAAGRGYYILYAACRHSALFPFALYLLTFLPNEPILYDNLCNPRNLWLLGFAKRTQFPSPAAFLTLPTGSLTLHPLELDMKGRI